MKLKTQTKVALVGLWTCLCPGWWMPAPQIIASEQVSNDRTPNIVILYADDMGYGDLSIQNPSSKIPTPHLDELARQGMRFNDGHSSSGICTPSRYALLTGRYHWRKFHNIVGPLGPSVFDPARLTLPEMLQKNGYHTACIGKWHLGWNWDAIRIAGSQPIVKGNRKIWPHTAFDWSKRIPDGPLDHGFDFYFGDAVINFPPYCWIENDRVTRIPNTTLQQVTGATKEGNWETRPGPALDDWDFYRVLPTLCDKAVQFVHESAKAEKPFFLYLPLPSPHAPIVPTDEFDRRSQAGAYGDFVAQTDWVCGQVLKALADNHLEQNTIVIFTSDNGPERYAYARERKFEHRSSAPFRGLKRDIYEGGHHVPFIVKWPGVTKPGTVSNQLVGQLDIMATLAGFLDFDLPRDSAEDSFDFFPALSRQSAEPAQGIDSMRDHLIHNTYPGKYAIRQGNWLLVSAPNGYHSGGWQAWEKQHEYPPDNDAEHELYDLKRDPGQRQNLAEEQTAKVREMQAFLQRVRSAEKSAPRLRDDRRP